MDGDSGGWRDSLPDLQVFESPAARRRFLVHLLAAVVVFGVVGFAARRHVAVLTDPAALRAFVDGFGAWGPLVLVAVQATQVVVAPVPGQVLAVAAGYLYGAWWGTAYNVAGVAVGSTVAFWLSRRYGRAYVERIVAPEALARFDGVDDDHVRLTLFVLFLIPGLPDDVLCFAGGLTKVPLAHLVALAVVGRAPAFFLVNVVGEFVGAGRYAEATLLVAALVAVSGLGYLNRDRILGLLGDES